MERPDQAREGDPICDQFLFKHFSNRIFFAIAGYLILHFEIGKLLCKRWM